MELEYCKEEIILLFSYLLLKLFPTSIIHTYIWIHWGKKSGKKPIPFSPTFQKTDLFLSLASPWGFCVCLGMRGKLASPCQSLNGSVDGITGKVTGREQVYLTSCSAQLLLTLLPSSWSVLGNRQAWLLASQSILTSWRKVGRSFPRSLGLKWPEWTLERKQRKERNAQSKTLFLITGW